MNSVTVAIGIIFLSSMSGFAASEKAIFAGGCFWCMEKPFEQIPGVKSVVSGYIGGKTKAPTYKQVSSGSTGHYEAVEITYDPKTTNFETLLFVFWQQINPTDNKGQFIDRGQQYAPGIFFVNEKQKELAERSKVVMIESKIFEQSVNTVILAATKFYKAENYHQDYYIKNPVRYWYYRKGSNRDSILDANWNDRKRALYKKNFEAKFPDKLGPVKSKTDKKPK